MNDVDALYDAATARQVTPTGFEHTTFSSGKTGVGEKSDAQIGALSGDSALGGALPGPVDPDLEVVINAWPNLSPEAKRQVLDIVRREGGDSDA